ncbi:MAG: translational GTPase TypA, partial [Pseudomonadota bacterium]
HINIVDTPGHADFGGEVERVLSMVDSVLLLVDAVDGPMPQTRFVTQKALQRGLKPIVVINKIDRDGARPNWALDQTFDLFDLLDATDEQLDFPVIYASALNGYASEDETVREGDMTPLFETIVENVSPPDVDPDAPFQLQISALDYTSYLGLIGIGRITRGQVKTNMPVTIIDSDGETRTGKVQQIFGFLGLERVVASQAGAGDIIAFNGLDPLYISDTLCAPASVEALPALTVDEPTVQMAFLVNTSPLAGKEGQFLTSRQIRERLAREQTHNVALRIEDTEDPDRFIVSGRGELHLSILIETMRREGYELAVSRPQVIIKEIDGQLCEPYEQLTAEVDDVHQGALMEQLGERRADLQNMIPDGKGRVRLDFIVPARGLIGFRNDFLTLTTGNGLMYHTFDHYGPMVDNAIGQRHNGVLVSMQAGDSVGYALFNLQARGRLFIDPGEKVYEGMIIGLHSRDNDLHVNPMKAKQLTNIRAAGTDENILLTPPVKFNLEQALTFVNDDELVEITPKAIRLRKKDKKRR